MYQVNEDGSVRAFYQPVATNITVVYFCLYLSINDLCHGNMPKLNTNPCTILFQSILNNFTIDVICLLVMKTPWRINVDLDILCEQTNIKSVSMDSHGTKWIGSVLFESVSWHLFYSHAAHKFKSWKKSLFLLLWRIHSVQAIFAYEVCFSYINTVYKFQLLVLSLISICRPRLCRTNDSVMQT